MAGGAPAGLCQTAPHDLAEVSLKPSIQRNNVGLGGPNHNLAGTQERLPRFILQSFKNKEEVETALKELDPEEVWHEADVGVEFQDLPDRVGCFKRMWYRRRKVWRGIPEVFVLHE